MVGLKISPESLDMKPFDLVGGGEENLVGREFLGVLAQGMGEDREGVVVGRGVCATIALDFFAFGDDGAFDPSFWSLFPSFALLDLLFFPIGIFTVDFGVFLAKFGVDLWWGDLLLVAAGDM